MQMLISDLFYMISCIIIQSGKEERLSDFVVALQQVVESPKKGPFPTSQVCHRHRGYPGPSETITVTCLASMTTLARYVYVYLEGEDRRLTLCELEVYSQEGSDPFVCAIFYIYFISLIMQQ